MSFGDINATKANSNRQPGSTFGDLSSKSEKDPITNLRDSMSAFQVIICCLLNELQLNTRL
jgi:hypothetical protein